MRMPSRGLPKKQVLRCLFLVLVYRFERDKLAHWAVLVFNEFFQPGEVVGIEIWPDTPGPLLLDRYQVRVGVDWCLGWKRHAQSSDFEALIFIDREFFCVDKLPALDKLV